MAQPGDVTLHSHDFSGSTGIPEQEVAAAKGTDSGYFGRHDTVTFSGSSDENDFHLPYIVTASCQPCVTGDSDPDCQ